MIELNNLPLDLNITAAALSDSDNQILLNSLNLGLAQYKVLAVLAVKQGITQREIAVALDQTEASISRQLTTMFNDGLVKSESKNGDRRVHLIVMTTRGKRIAKKAQAVLAKNNKAVFGKLSVQQRDQFASILKKLR